MCICVYVCACEYNALGEQKRVSELPDAGVIGSCELLDMGAGN